MGTTGTDREQRLLALIHGAAVPAIAILFSICIVMVRDISQRRSGILDACLSAIGYVGAVGLGALFVCLIVPRTRFRYRVVWSMCVALFVLGATVQQAREQNSKERGVLDSLVSDFRRDLHLDTVALQQATGSTRAQAPRTLTIDQWLKKNSDAAQVAANHLQTAMATFDLGQPFAPEVITSGVRMKAAVANAQHQIDALSRYILETDEMLAQSRREISAIQASEHARAQLAIGFEKSSAGIPEMERLVRLEQDQLHLVMALENLLLREQGRYRLEDGRPMFVSNESMSEYNENVKKLAELDDRVQSASEVIKASYDNWQQQLELTVQKAKDIK